MSEKIVNTTDEKVRKAAESCPDAKRVLKELFPEVFPPSPFKKGDILTNGGGVYILTGNGIGKPYQHPYVDLHNGDRLEVGEFNPKYFHLITLKKFCGAE